MVRVNTMMVQRPFNNRGDFLKGLFRDIRDGHILFGETRHEDHIGFLIEGRIKIIIRKFMGLGV